MLSYGDMLDALASYETKNTAHSEKKNATPVAKKEKIEEVIIDEKKGEKDNENKSDL